MALIYVLLVLVLLVAAAGWMAPLVLLGLFGGLVALIAVFGTKKKPGHHEALAEPLQYREPPQAPASLSQTTTPSRRPQPKQSLAAARIPAIKTTHTIHPPASPLVSTPAADNLTKFFDLCESEPERRLLAALVTKAGLSPSGKFLQGAIKLMPQARILNYRADFLVNDFLVVEVDGKQYHTAPDIVEADKYRDQALIEAGFTAIRFPASQIFKAPQDVAARIMRIAQARAHRVGAVASPQEVEASATGSQTKAVIDCPECFQRLRVAQGQPVDIECPFCKALFRTFPT